MNGLMKHIDDTMFHNCTKSRYVEQAFCHLMNYPKVSNPLQMLNVPILELDMS